MANRKNTTTPAVDPALVAVASALQPLDTHSHTTAIQAAVTSEIGHVMGAKHTTQRVQDEGKAAVKAEGETRRSIYIRLAAASLNGGWSQAHIDEGVTTACDAYVNARNDETEKALAKSTLNTFASECKRVMHPMVREHVESAYIVGQAAWDAEGATLESERKAWEALPKDKRGKFEPPETPLRDAYKKLDFMVKSKNGMLGAYMHDDAAVRAKAGDPAAMAEHVSGVQASDAKAAANAIAKHVEALREIASRFPDASWAAPLATLESFDKAKLEAFAKVRDAKAHAANPLKAVTHAPKAGAVPAQAAVAANTLAAVDELTLLEMLPADKLAAFIKAKLFAK